MEVSLTQQLVSDLCQKGVNDADKQRALMHVLDWIGCVSLGKQSQAGDIYQQLLNLSDSQACTSLFGGKGDWQSVVQHNAALGNVLEMDDIHRSSILHPGPVVNAVALTFAEMTGANLSAFLSAIIKGYEVTIRLGEAIGRSHYRHFHNTSTCAAMGAAMAAASLLELNEEQTVWALGNVGSRTGGLWQMRNEKVLTKQWHNAEAARSGAMAALLAKQGLTGPAFILEGPQGIFSAMSDDADPQMFVARHDTWRIYDCSFKPWPACRHAHPAIDVFMQAWQPGTDVSSVDIYTYQDARVFCDRLTPETELQAKFSIQHALAAIIKWGEPALVHYTPDYFNHPEAVALRNKITVHDDPDKESAYPFHYGARCVITLSDGTTLEFDQQDTLGDPECPMSNAQIKAKASTLLLSAGLDSKITDNLVSLTWAESEDLQPLLSLLN